MGIGEIMVLRKAIFLDRDGVLNDAVVKNGKPYPPSSLSEVTIPDDVPNALQLLREKGFLLIGATNQPDVARGTTSQKTVEDINNFLIKKLSLHDIRVCYHDDKDHCECRKPRPGLLLNAARDYHVDLKNSFMIGDRYKDVEAGLHAGCRTIWLRRDYLEKNPSSPPHFIASTFLECALWILKTLNQESSS